MHKRNRARVSPRTGAVIIVCGVAVVAALWYVQSLGPIDPYHASVAQTMRSELAELPPYPGSSAVQTILKARVLDYYSSLLVLYDLSGRCSDVQSYYATQAEAAGWTTETSPHVLHRDTNPDHDFMDSRYQKTAHGYTVELVIECYIDQSFSGGYSVSLNIPPDLG